MAGKIRRGRVGADDGIFCARPSVYGNMFSVKDFGRAEAIKLYVGALDIMTQIEGSETQRAVYNLARRVKAGEDFVLLCYCRLDQECHVDVLIQKVYGLVEDKKV